MLLPHEMTLTELWAGAEVVRVALRRWYWWSSPFSRLLSVDIVRITLTP